MKQFTSEKWCVLLGIFMPEKNILVNADDITHVQLLPQFRTTLSTKWEHLSKASPLCLNIVVNKTNVRQV